MSRWQEQQTALKARVLELHGRGMSFNEIGRSVQRTGFAVARIVRVEQSRRARIRPDAGPDDPLDAHDLSTRIRNAVRSELLSFEERAAGKTVSLRDIAARTRRDVLSWPNMGHASIIELEACLVRHGLAFANDPCRQALPEPALVLYDIRNSDGRTLLTGVARLIKLQGGRMRLEPVE